MIKTVIGATLCLAICAGAALAQNPPPASPPAPAATPAPAAAPTTATAPAPGSKKAISKACTDQANAKGLHGKARKKFRSDCKKNGGTPS
jgi:hypothetical protein